MRFLRGTVKWFNIRKRFGFIEVEGSKDVFVHANEVTGTIRDGDEVEFTVEDAPKGPQAKNVRKVQ